VISPKCSHSLLVGAMVLQVSLGCCDSIPRVDGINELLVGGFRAGSVATHGIYRLSDGGDLELVLRGGRHPHRSPQGDYWFCLRNGLLWIEPDVGNSRQLPQALVTDVRRFAQPVGPTGDFIVRLQDGAAPQWPETLDVRRWLSAPGPAATLLDLLAYPPTSGDQPDPLWATVSMDLSIDILSPQCPWGIIDMAGCDRSMEVAVVAVRYMEYAGVLGPRVADHPSSHGPTSRGGQHLCPHTTRRT